MKIKILLVDDLKDNLLALEGLLRRGDVEIIKAASGTEALELMMLNEFALALIDVQMPGMSGFELAELMRGASKTKSIPIIFVTATANEKNFSFKGYESGAVDFLLKPLDIHAVRSKANIFIELFSQKMELKELLAKLHQTQDELENSILMRDEFMSIASHEMRTPLTTLLLQSQMRKRSLEKGDFSMTTPEKLIKMFDSNERELSRFSHLIDDMLDISRISSGKLSMKLERFDLCKLVQDLVERCAELFKVNNCTLSCDFCPEAVGTWDRFRVEQVVTNLLTNAMRYGAGKPIHVEVTCARNMAQIIVRDHGRGIAIEDQARIFKRFERAVEGTEINGLGLGLYIVSQIIEAHQGVIRVESKLGEGSTFFVELPILES